jgi:hypothetical protein
VGIICEVCSGYDVDRGQLIDYYRDKLEYVDGYECSVLVVGFEEQCPALDLLGEVDVPPEA